MAFFKTQPLYQFTKCENILRYSANGFYHYNAVCWTSVVLSDM